MLFGPPEFVSWRIWQCRTDRRSANILIAPLDQLIEKAGDGIPKIRIEIVFDVQDDFAEVSPNDDAICFQLAQILRQHLFGRARNKSRQLPQANWPRAQYVKNLKFPLALKQQLEGKRCLRNLTEARRSPVDISDIRHFCTRNMSCGFRPEFWLALVHTLVSNATRCMNRAATRTNSHFESVMCVP
jgi:hypothetical protein